MTLNFRYGRRSTREPPDLNQVSARATKIYQEQLRSSLEPDHIGEVVAIHVETGDFAVGKTPPSHVEPCVSATARG
jgi:hypothetical protein